MKICDGAFKQTVKNIELSLLNDLVSQEGFDPKKNIRDYEGYHEVVYEQIAEDNSITLEEVYNLFDYIQHKNIIENEVIADNIWIANNEQPLHKTYQGESSEIFTEILDHYQDNFNDAYIAKAKLYAKTVELGLGNWTSTINKEELINDGILNDQGEPKLTFKNEGAFKKLGIIIGQKFIPFIKLTTEEKRARYRLPVKVQAGIDPISLEEVSLYDMKSFRAGKLYAHEEREAVAFLKNNIIEYFLKNGVEGFSESPKLFWLESISNEIGKQKEHRQKFEAILSDPMILADIQRQEEVKEARANLVIVNENIEKLFYLKNNFIRSYTEAVNHIQKYINTPLVTAAQQYDVDPMTINSLNRVGPYIRLMMEGLPVANEIEGKQNPLNIFYNQMSYSSQEVNNKLRSILQDSAVSSSDMIEKLKNYLVLNPTEIWASKFLERLDNADDHIKNMFVNVFSTTFLDKTFIRWGKKGWEVASIHKEGQFVYQKWVSMLQKAGLITPNADGDGYLVNKEKVQFHYESFLALKQTVLNSSGKYNNVAVRQLFELIGIQDLSDETIRKIISGKLKHVNSKINKQYLFSEDKGVGAVLKVLLDKYGKLGSEKLPGPMRLFDGTYIKMIAKEESLSSNYLHEEFHGDEKLYPFIDRLYWADRIIALKKEDVRAKLKLNYWSRNSMFIEHARMGELKFFALPPGVIEKPGYNNDKKFPNLTKRDNELLRLALFINDTFFYSEAGRLVHKMKKTLLTPSDSKNIYGVEHPAFQFTDMFDEFKTGKEQVIDQLSDIAIDKYFEIKVQPEIDRILLIEDGKSTSSKAWNEHGRKFIAMPELNILQMDIVASDGNTVVRSGSVLNFILKQKDEQGNLISFYDDYKNQIEAEIKNYLKTYIKNTALIQKQTWIDSGMIKKGESGEYLDGMKKEAWAEFIKAVHSVRNDQMEMVKGRFARNQALDLFAYYYAYNNLLSDANEATALEHDPVFFATVDKTIDKNEVSKEFMLNSIATSLNILKRGRMYTTTRQQFDKDRFPKGLGFLFIKEPVMSAGMDAFLAANNINNESYNDVKIADGHGYVTPKTALYLLMMDGSISKQQYDENLAHYRQYGTLKDQHLRSGFSKPVYTGNIEETISERYNPEMKSNEPVISEIPFYGKYGQSTLYPDIYKGSPKHYALLRKLEELEDNDPRYPDHIIVAPPTAVKTYEPNITLVDPFNEEEFNEDYFNLALKKLSVEGYGIQQREPNKDLKEGQAQISFSVQMKNFILSGVIDKTGFNIPKIADNISGQQLFNHYDKIVGKIYAHYEDKFWSTRLGINKNSDIKDPVVRKTVNKNLSALLKKRLQDREDANVLEERFDIDPTTGEFIKPLFTGRQNVFLERMLLSIINGDIFDHDMPGNSMYLVPNYDLDWTRPKDTRIIWTENKKTQRLEPPSESHPVLDVILPSKLTTDDGVLIDLFEPDDTDPTKYKWIDETANGFVLKQNIERDIFNTVAYRVPSPEMSFYAGINVVGFSPDYTQTIMAHHSVMSKMGSDNDADKLFVYIKNHKFNPATQKIEAEVEKDDLKVWQNKIIDIYRAILINPAMQKSVWKSVDSTVKKKEIQTYRQIQTNNVSDIRNYMYQDKLMRDNSATKDGTGVYASFAHLINQIYLLKAAFNKNFTVQVHRNKETKNGFMFLPELFAVSIAGSKFSGIVNPYISDDLNQMSINAENLNNALDNSGKQIMSVINDNQKTFPVKLAMVMFGLIGNVEVSVLGKDNIKTDPVNLLLNQPVIKDYLRRIDNMKSEFDFVSADIKGDVLKAMFGPDKEGSVFDKLKPTEEEEMSSDFAGLSYYHSNRIVQNIPAQNLFDSIIEQTYDKNDPSELAKIVMFESLYKYGQSLQMANRFIGMDRTKGYNNLKEYYEMKVAMEEFVDNYSVLPQLSLLIHPEEGNTLLYAGKGFNIMKNIMDKLFFGGRDALIPNYYNSLYFRRSSDLWAAYARTRTQDGPGNVSLIPYFEDLNTDLALFKTLDTININGVSLIEENTLNDMNEIERLRRTMLRTEGNQYSLGQYIQYLRVLSISAAENPFLAKLNIVSDNDIDLIQLPYHLFKEGTIKDVMNGVNDLIKNNELFNVKFNGEVLKFDGKVLTGEALVKYLFLYSRLSGMKKKSGDIMDVISAQMYRDYVKEMLTIESEHDADDPTFDEKIVNFVVQRLMHDPASAQKIYNSFERLSGSDNVKMYTADHVLTKNATEVSYFTYTYLVTDPETGIESEEILTSFNSVAVRYNEADNPKGFMLFINDGFGKMIKVDVLGGRDFSEYNPLKNWKEVKSVYSKISVKEIDEDNQDFYGSRRNNIPIKIKIHDDVITNGYDKFVAGIEQLTASSSTVIEPALGLFDLNTGEFNLKLFTELARVMPERYTDISTSFINAVNESFYLKVRNYYNRLNQMIDADSDTTSGIYNQMSNEEKESWIRDLDVLESEFIAVNNLNSFAQKMYGEPVVFRGDLFAMYDRIASIKKTMMIHNSMNLYSVEDSIVLIDEMIDYINKMPWYYRERFEMLKKTFGTISEINYSHEIVTTYKANGTDLNPYNGVYYWKNKIVKVGLNNFIDGDKFDVEEMIKTLIHEIEHHYYGERMSDHIEMYYESEKLLLSNDSIIEVYKKKEGVTIDPHLELLVELFQYFQDKTLNSLLGKETLTEEDEDMLYRVTSLTEFIAMTYELEIDNAGKEIITTGMNRFPLLQNYVLKNEGAVAVDILHEVMNRLYPDDKIGVTSNKEIKTDLPLRKIKCS